MINSDGKTVLRDKCAHFQNSMEMSVSKNHFNYIMKRSRHVLRLYLIRLVSMIVFGTIDG